MNLAEISALADGLAPVIRDLMGKATEPLIARIDSLEAALAEARAVDHVSTIRAAVDEAVAALPAPAPGKDADPAEIGRLVKEAVERIPPAAPGKDADPELVATLVAQKVNEAVAALPVPKNGKDADPDEVEQLVTETVARMLSGWEKPKDGTSVTVDDVAPIIERAVAEQISKIPAPEPGREGPAGKLPLVKEYEPGVHYEADVVTHKGGTYQARKDTAQDPGGDDWICLAAPGRDGADGRSICIRGTFSVDAEYSALDLVALNGGSFIAKRDNPGPCPGEGWQLVASQGKTGKPGERGIPGRGERGDPGLPVVAASINDAGMLTLVNGDGSTVDCDLYPLLAKVN